MSVSEWTVIFRVNMEWPLAHRYPLMWLTEWLLVHSQYRYFLAYTTSSYEISDSRIFLNESEENGIFQTCRMLSFGIESAMRLRWPMNTVGWLHQRRRAWCGLPDSSASEFGFQLDSTVAYTSMSALMHTQFRLTQNSTYIAPLGN